MLGSGLLKGLAVTAKNLVGSFHDPARLVTVEYPEQRVPVGENYRSFPFLIHDGDDPIDTLRCVACKICENECPPQCIYIVIERDEKGRPKKKPRIFDIDLSVCMSCGICAETCPFDSIKMDKVFEVTATDRFNGLLVHREQLAKSNAYYHQIRPAEAAEVDARLAEEKRVAEEKAKAAAAVKAAAAAKPPATPTPSAPPTPPATAPAQPSPNLNPAPAPAGATKPAPPSA